MQVNITQTKSMKGRDGLAFSPVPVAISRHMVRPAEEPRRLCGIVRQLTAEMILMSGERVLRRRDSRRTLCHARQISMYVCNVALGISHQDIGLAFGRDRTTVGYSCNVVEDRRDDPGFDEFVSSIERVATLLCVPGEGVAGE